MHINSTGFPFRLSNELLKILNLEISKAEQTSPSGLILNFRDPDYSAERGGFHPVEISISATGSIQYMTDFSFVGMPPQAELVKEIDFDFGLKLFQHFGRDYPIEQGRELFSLWQENFCAYYAMGVYLVEIHLR